MEMERRTEQLTEVYLLHLCLLKKRSDRTEHGHVLTRRKFTNIRYPTDIETRKEYAHVTVIR